MGEIVMSNIVKLKTQKYSIDWTYEYEIDIDVDQYVFFTAEYRLNSWHLIGHKCDQNYNWTTEELSYHWVFLLDMADFIAKANSIKDKSGFTRCRVSKFNSLHYCNSFYSELSKLLKLVEEKQAKLKELEEN